MPRSAVLLGLALMTGVACRPVATIEAAPATPTAPAPTAQAQPAFRQPRELISSGGLLRVRLVVEQRTVRLAGQDVKALTYNGDYMPPTLRLRPGDRLDLTLVNRLGEHTNLHTHGWHVSPSGNSDNVYLHIMPGQTYHYSYRLPKDLEPGTYWYHSHAHPISEPQVFAGLSGAIVIDGLDRYLPRRLHGITERLIALKDFQVHDGAIPTTGIDSNASTTRTVNGLVNPVIHIRPGETQLWRLANISADIAYNVRLEGARLTVLAQDANPANRVWSDEALLLPPGARYDVLVQGPPAGRTRLITTAYNTGPDGDSYPETTLATLVSAGRPMWPASIPAAFAPIDDLSKDRIDRRRTITFSENDETNQFFINGKLFDPDRIDARAKLNTTEEWLVRNASDEQHTFHVHVNDFQLMSVNGRPYHFRGWQDTVQLPVRGEVVIRMRFRDFTGKYPFHCHILNHEDRGMMANIEVTR
ncbi:multicopper oxidase family protein [Nonomuraea sp. K274]|uniref:Multicopper oxidase family protein n=1 Tax=Nonomuraea cypriaca TaxID=1187855 RepID=A0A931A2P3_9ACTN|nr:multicopper oxidase family protein [Nonomuraea cypriaca]MBF8185101.1 multicopper oxidase family protein [Nonomuraea cypriaca]